MKLKFWAWISLLCILLWASFGLAQDAEPFRIFSSHMGWVLSVAFSPDGAFLASGSDNGIYLWNVQSGNLLRTFSRHTGSVSSVAFSPNGALLASGSDNTMNLWSVETGDLLRTFSGHTDWMESVAFAPDAKTLASGSMDNKIKLWDVATGSVLHTLSGHMGYVWSVAFSPDGKILASGYEDHTIKLWDVQRGSVIRTLTGHSRAVESIAFSPDGKTLASGSGDRKIKLWDVGSGSCILTISGHTWDVNSVVFSPDGKILASGAYDKEVKLWDIATGRILQTLSSHTDRVSSVSFSPNGKILASGSRDGTILLWDVDMILHPDKSPIAQFTAYTLSPTGARLIVRPRVSDRVWFDATGSSDPDGNVVKYEWDWDSDGSFDASITDPVIGHVFTTPGTHKVTLQVTDDKGGTAEVTKTLTIGEKQAPKASFSFSPVSLSVLDTVQFTDSSSDSDGQVVKWEWDFGDGATSTERNPSHKYTQKKTYAVKLTVTDDDGLTDVVTKQLMVVNVAPTAIFSFSPEHPCVNQPVAFDASSSTDKDGTITSCSWDFNGDGKTDAQGEEATWTFNEAGTYTIKLTVTDDDGATASHEEEITVKAAPPGPPKFNDEWGLVVGIADYQDASITDLKFTEDDAQAFYDFLIDRNEGGFPKDHVRLLLGKEATLNGMTKGLDWLSSVAGVDDLVVFYYAGHGATVPDKNHDEAKVKPGDNLDECLVPYNAELNSLAATTLVDDAIGYWFSNLSSQHVLMVFDSCFSGGASREVRSFGKGGARAAAGNEVFTDIAGGGKLFLAASQADQSSFEDGILKHGVFTYFLLRGLGDKTLPAVEGLSPITTAEADKDGDGRVTVEEMKDYLDEKVPPFVRQHEDGGAQTPVLSGDEALRDVRLDGYGVPLSGEVTAIQGNTIIISLGSRHGIQPGDRFEVIRPLTLPDGTIVNEVEATIEVLYILGPDRAGCKVVEPLFPIMVKDQVRPAE